ncbi:MAG: FAD-dependent oxidoreductase [Proteobacteria bacterium]|nr:FAD-dependent oxidoreductase [Pseudomonadota bacterium]
MAAYTPDPKSIAGTTLNLHERVEVLVIGAGPAGLAAAMEAARLGRSVVLVDENPIAPETMGENLPLHFGGGMTQAVRNRNAMLEAVVASAPEIAEAFEAGIDIRLGTACWGLYAPSPAVGWLPGPVAGLVDGERTWMVGAERIIVATGRRDMGLAFTGWEKDGVMGLTAALRLAQRYAALRTRRAVVLGSTAETLQGALALRAAGVEIAALIETNATSAGPEALLAELERGGTQLLFGQAPKRAEGADAIEALAVGPVSADGAPIAGAEMTIACDTVLLGIGAVPVIELLDALGCRTVFDTARGGVVPVLDPAQQTTIAGVCAAGDCAGIWAEKTLDTEVARAEGRRAAGGAEAAVSPPAASYDLGAYRLNWVRAAVLETDGTAHVCQCEEVTAREILEVRPPRYLGWESRPSRRNSRDIRSLLGAAPPNPDQVKRLTRAGMGVCQGRRCREQVTALLALATGEEYGSIPAATYRAPVRPLPLMVAAAASEESPAMAQHWDTWFGMPSQYLPPWDLPETYTAASRPKGHEVASE